MLFEFENLVIEVALSNSSCQEAMEGVSVKHVADAVIQYAVKNQSMGYLLQIM